MSNSLLPLPEPSESLPHPDAASASADNSLNHATLKRRARMGILLLTGRTVLQQLTILVGNVYLARLLGPAEFGAFWIIQFALSFFSLFGDAGFGAALIQKKSVATKEELSSVFWSQLLLAAAIVLVVFAAAPRLVLFWPDLPKGSGWMLRALSLSLLLTTLRVVPAILMERELLFGRLSVVDLVLTTTFYVSAVVLAHLGYGAFALVTAVLVQGVTGLVTAYALRPWIPGFHWRSDLLRPILKFGVAYQAKHIIGFVNAAVIPLYAGRALGRYPLGLVTWAQNTAYFPLKAVEILSRVNFPLLSRLQDDRQAFARSLERTVQLCALITLSFVALVLGIGPRLVAVIYGPKWTPALPALYVFAVAISIGFISPVVNGALDAVGKPRIMMYIGGGWTALNWVAVALVMQFRSDALSFTMAYCVHIVVGNSMVIFVVKRLFPDCLLLPKLSVAILAATATAAIGRWMILPWISGPISLTLAAVADLGVFASVVGLIDRSALLEILALIRRRKSNA